MIDDALLQEDRPSPAGDLERAFRSILDKQMRDMPMLNPALCVEAVGFRPWSDHWLGILVTPWFMNLVRLPLARVDATDGVGLGSTLELGGRAIGFLGAHEAAIGAFDACSLFSPMFEFANPAAACGVAEAVLADLRGAPAPARRSFLFGRTQPLAR